MSALVRERCLGAVAFVLCVVCPAAYIGVWLWILFGRHVGGC